MATETTTTEAPHTTVVERRGSGAGILIGLAILILAIVGAFYLINQSQNERVETQAIQSAAQSVGDAADSVGDAVEGSTD
ncbi:hypothetical protein [Stakelama tenebrarum]|uniref:Uncharacterized protein n=1 Tax=Stakelama tenebrarum TaxID=2711215 RepID=A0A6G6Y6U2_9SPHN|nr:hypothetical protein [Sphingosinithalassobacter tenebrarum]QIG80664.1 hypothetical protein G5C33_13330 [Sphingosinithalassobacter tenebrarum]